MNWKAKEKISPWMELPEELWSNILQRLGAIDILLTAEKVCTTWRRVCKHPSMWRVIRCFCCDFNFCRSDVCYDFVEMCRHAVDRSQGELVDFSIGFPAFTKFHFSMEFYLNELLPYVAERSRKLKRLNVACCNGMVRKGLMESVQKLPLLEELSLTRTTITTEGIEAVGRSCSQLKSFKLNVIGFKQANEKNDEEALAIAKNLPGLHHLQLIGNNLTGKGLEAILDGCPHLVSLDLRACFNLPPVCWDHLSLYISSSGKISRQIKHVKGPFDSMIIYRVARTR